MVSKCFFLSPQTLCRSFHFLLSSTFFWNHKDVVQPPSPGSALERLKCKISLINVQWYSIFKWQQFNIEYWYNIKHIRVEAGEMFCEIDYLLQQTCSLKVKRIFWHMRRGMQKVHGVAIWYCTVILWHIWIKIWLGKLNKLVIFGNSIKYEYEYEIYNKTIS